jgi:RecA-family ATPase
MDFLGKPTRRGGVVYVTGEGQTGIAKRVAALAAELSLSEQAPFLYVSVMPRLLDPQQVTDFITALKFTTEHWEVPLEVMAFDTFNRAIVGGSENEGKDVARLLDADNRIKEEFGCATIYAHHPGKAEGNDTRGHSL